MGVIVRKPPVSTKIAVAIDDVARWRSSDRRLLEGEIAVSYENVYDPKDRRHHKRNFQIRIGRKLPDGSCSTWKDAAELQVSSLSPELKATLVAEIIKKAGDVFVFRSQFDEVVQEIGILSSQIQDHVNAKVVEETLFLLRNSELGILTKN